MHSKVYKARKNKTTNNLIWDWGVAKKEGKGCSSQQQGMLYDRMDSRRHHTIQTNGPCLGVKETTFFLRTRKPPCSQRVEHLACRRRRNQPARGRLVVVAVEDTTKQRMVATPVPFCNRSISCICGEHALLTAAPTPGTMSL